MKSLFKNLFLFAQEKNSPNDQGQTAGDEQTQPE
jgi:hypothetical protein